MVVVGLPCNPGCFQCCSIRNDDFTTFGTSDITDFAWTPQSGTWDNSFALMTCTGTGLATCDSAQPDGDPTMAVTVQFTHDTNGSHVDVIVGYVDASHYFYVRYNIASGTGGSIDVRQNNGGTHTSLVSTPSVPINVGTLYTAMVCVNEAGNISGQLGNYCARSAPQTVTGTQAGLGTGTSGTVSFYNWSLSKSHNSVHATSCPRCGCHDEATCGPKTVIRPDAVTLTTGSGFSSNGSQDVAACDASLTIHLCPTLNGSFDLGAPNPVVGIGLACAYLSGTCCWSRELYVLYPCTRSNPPFNQPGALFSATMIVGVVYYESADGKWRLYAIIDTCHEQNLASESHDYYYYRTDDLPLDANGKVNPIGTWTIPYYQTIETGSPVRSPAGAALCNIPSTVTVDVY